MGNHPRRSMRERLASIAAAEERNAKRHAEYMQHANQRPHRKSPLHKRSTDK